MYFHIDNDSAVGQLSNVGKNFQKTLVSMQAKVQGTATTESLRLDTDRAVGQKGWI